MYMYIRTYILNKPGPAGVPGLCREQPAALAGAPP